MKQNPQEPVIILFASKETIVQNNTQYLVIIDKGGEKHKISEKRQPLWALFQAPRDGEPFMLVYETYQKARYVADARPITDDLLKLAVQKTVLKLNDQQTEERNRSQSIAYAKDLCCANQPILAIDDMFDMATKIYNFIKGANQ